MVRLAYRQTLTLAAFAGLATLVLALAGAAVNPWVTLTAGMVTALLLVSGAWAGRHELGRALTGRSARYGAFSSALVLAVTAILVLLNFLADRHPWRYDVTASGRYTLTEPSREVLAGLPGPVEAIACYSATGPGGGELRQKIEDLLEQYEYASGGRFTYRLLDPVRDPAEAARLKLTGETTILRVAGRETRTEGTTEQAITESLLKILRPESRKVLFLEGHGGGGLDDSSPKGFLLARQALEKENCQVGTLSLAREGGVPADCQVLVLAGPQGDLLPGEAARIGDYVHSGGGLLALLDPPGETGMPVLEGLLSGLGVVAGADLVVDPLAQALVGDPLVPVASTYGEHEITRRLSIISYFPLCRSITPGSGGAAATELVQSSPQSFAELDPQTVRYDEGVDRPGPISLAVALELPPPPAGAEHPPAPAAAPAAGQEEGAAPGESGREGIGSPAAPGEEELREAEKEPRGGRLAVFGDSDFAANPYFAQQGNGNLLLNTVSWLGGEKPLLSLRPRTSVPSTIDLSRVQSRVILVLAVFAFPLTVFLGGLSIWWRRRRL